MSSKKYDLITSYFDSLISDPKTELDYSNIFELLVAVILSAQTTDKAVNKVTPKLFEKYPTPNALAIASLDDVENLIKTIGLYKTKATNLIAMANKLVNNFNSQIPKTMEELVTLNGVGRKTASVVLIEGFNIPAFPVDTHVSRVAKRLNLVKEKDSAYAIEIKLKKFFKKDDYRKVHHQMILFGRYHCKALNPQCENCQLKPICIYKKDANK